MASDKPISHNDTEVTNLAVNLKEEDRRKIADIVCDDYNNDLYGRRDWERRRNQWFKLWLGQKDPKTTPFPGASNVSLPMLAIACNQFHARSYQAMFSPPKFVKILPTEENDIEAAKHKEDFMNWQIQNDMDDFEEEHDNLLLNIPISGTNFIKGYYDRKNEKPVSEYVSGMDVILPYRTRKLNTARRVTHRIYLH